MRDKFRSNLIYFVNRSMLFFQREKDNIQKERVRERERKDATIYHVYEIYMWT